MADSKGAPVSTPGSTCFKEAVCIDAGRIYDSCSDKDCLEDLQVYFCDTVQPLVDAATSVKCRCVEVLNVLMDVESVPFNRGFYSVDMTFYFLVKLDVYSSPMCPPCAIEGIACFNKKVILYGSEGNVRVFSSDSSQMNGCGCGAAAPTNLPKASVQVVDPIILNCKLCECPANCCDCIAIPQPICCRFDGNFNCVSPGKTVFITLGVFSIVQIERHVQMLIPAYDFCIPDKECVSSGSDDPCELFKRVKFPTNEFFPPRLADLDDENLPTNSCGC